MNKSIQSDRRAPTHYENWVVANSKTLATHLANIFLKKFGHKMRDFALVPQVTKTEPEEHWKASCFRCDKTIHVIRDKNDIKRSWEDNGALAYLSIPQYKINYGRLFKSTTTNKALHASFSLMDPIPDDIKILKQYPLVSKVERKSDFGNRVGATTDKWIENLFEIPLDSFETCEMEGVVNDDFYCSRLRVLI